MNRKLIAVFIFSFLAVAGLFIAKDIFKGGRDMTEHTFETRTWCIGRFLVDVPVQFEIRHSGHSFDGVRIAALGPGAANDLERIVQHRIRELQAGVEEGGAVRKLRDHHTENSIDIVTYTAVIEIDGYVDEFYDAEAYFLKGNQIFKTTRLIDTQKETSDHAALIRVSQAVRPRANDEIPTGVGACIENAFVALPQGQESISAAFLDPDVKRFGMELEFYHRANAAKAYTAIGLKTAVSSARSVAGYTGREAIFVEQAETRRKSGLRFIYSGGQDTPVGGSGLRISFELWKNYALPDDPPYDEATSRAIWNGVLNSIRERGVK